MAQWEKRSVSLPPELARAVEEAARAEGTTFSAWLAQTAAHRLRLEAGRQALAEWERENGSLTEAELAEGRARARSSLGRGLCLTVLAKESGQAVGVMVSLALQPRADLF